MEVHMNTVYIFNSQCNIQVYQYFKILNPYTYLNNVKMMKKLNKCQELINSYTQIGENNWNC